MQGAHFTQTGRAHFFAHLDQQRHVVAQLALARRDDLLECCEVDRVLTFVIRCATPIPTVATNAQGPGCESLVPLWSISADHIAMPISQYGEICLRLGPARNQKRRPSFDRIRYDFAVKAQLGQQRRELIGEIRSEHRNLARLLTLRRNRDPAFKGGLKLTLIKIGGG